MESTASHPRLSRQRLASAPRCKIARSRCLPLQNHKRSLHRNQQYSITALTDAIGAIIERYAYTAYGTPTITDASGTPRTTTAVGNRYTYTGREWDETLALYHYRARMYDSVAGRFLSRDPIGYASRFNLAVYVENSPTARMDAFGLDSSSPHTAVNISECQSWFRKEVNRLSHLPHADWHRVYSSIVAAYAECKRRVNNLPLDDRPIDFGVDISTYNCAGLALRRYDYEPDISKLKAELAAFETPCHQDCKCGESKCRLWDWTTRLYRKESGKFEIEWGIRDYHIVCSRIPGEIGTAPEPRCYEKMGSGPITGPVYPWSARPTPDDVPLDEPALEARLEDMKETCYCLPKDFK